MHQQQQYRGPVCELLSATWGFLRASIRLLFSILACWVSYVDWLQANAVWIMPFAAIIVLCFFTFQMRGHLVVYLDEVAIPLWSLPVKFIGMASTVIKATL